MNKRLNNKECQINSCKYNLKALLFLFILFNLSNINLNAQCSVDYFGFWGDTPANTPNATTLNSITGITASAMTGGAGVTLTYVQETGSSGLASVFRMAGLTNNTTFSTAVTNNDYIYTLITVPANYNKLRLGRIRMKNIGGTSTGRGASIWGVQIYDVTAGTSTTVFQDVAIADGATSDVNSITAYDMLPGKTYQIRIFVYGLSGGANVTTRSFDNPALSFNVLPVLSSTTATFCQGESFNLNSLVTNTAVSTANSNLQWYSNAGLTTLVGNAGAVGAGTYYASYRDNTNNCNNPAAGPVTVTVTSSGCPDADGDGVIDALDLDDDNDGILDNVECGITCNDPFINGGFESPDISNSTNVLQSTSGIGWQTTATDNYIELWNTGHSGVPSAEGSQFAELNATQASTLYQTFCVNGAGGTVNWSVKHRGRSGVDVAAVKFGSTIAEAQASSAEKTMSDGNTAWGSYSGTYNIPAGPTTLVVAFQAISSNGGDPTFGNFIDDVQISINQACFDTDNDGTPNSLDLDSDGDGCFDAVEGAGSITAAQAPSGAITGGIDGNGVPTAVSGGQAIGNSQNAAKNDCIDTDHDGVVDWVDLDDDNDGILDTVEGVSNSALTALNASVEIDGTPSYNASLICTASKVSTGSKTMKFGVRWNNGTSQPDTRAILNVNIGGVNYLRIETPTDGGVNADNATEFGGDAFITTLNGATFTNSLPSSQGNNYIDHTPYLSATGLATITLTVPVVISSVTFNYDLSGDDFVVADAEVVNSCQLDTDGDGTPNQLDLDSDGDACSDAIEGDENVAASQLNANGSINGGVGANGVPSLVNSGGAADIGGDEGQGIGNSLDFLKNDCNDSDNDGISDWIDLDDDNDGILDSVECPASAEVQLNAFVPFNPAVIPGTGLVVGNRVLKMNAITYLGVSYDAVLEITGISVGAGTVGLTAGGDLAINSSTPNTNPYITYNLKFVPTGTASPTLPIVGTSIGNLTISLADIDGNGVANSIGDVVGYSSSNNVTGIVKGANIGQQGFTLGVTGMNGPGATAFNYYRPSDLTASSGVVNTTIVGDPLYKLSLYHTSYTVGSFVYGITGAQATSVGQRAQQMFIQSYNACDNDGDGFIDELDTDSDGDGCLDAVEGDENVLVSQLAGNRISGSVDANGVPIRVNSGGSADIGSDQGQGIGTSQNASSQETASITAQPLATQTVNHTAASTNLTVTASGSPSLTYQWFSNTSNSNTGGVAISGSVTNTYTPSTATVGTQYYYVEVTGSCGTVKSNVSTVIVQAQTNLTVTKSVDNSSPLVGTDVTFTIIATNGGPSPATGVSVSDVLSATGYTYKSSSATLGSYNNATGVWAIGALANGASATLILIATVKP